jgi:hypothetical protein
MDTYAQTTDSRPTYPVDIHIETEFTPRDRLTCALRFLLAFPHVLMVGGPIGAVLTWNWAFQGENSILVGAGGGALGAAAGMGAVIAWFWIVITGKHPEGLWNLSTFYMRWRIRAVAYTALLRDEFPPFGDADYPAAFIPGAPPAVRNRVTVGLRLFLVIPHILAVWVLGIAWVLTTVVAWFAIVFTGEYPKTLYAFALGVFRWNTRVEAYLLLLTDEYPPFSLT